jgi:hypothetical protein
MDVLLLRANASAGMCLPSSCLAMGLYVTIFKEIYKIVSDYAVLLFKMLLALDD